MRLSNRAAAAISLLTLVFDAPPAIGAGMDPPHEVLSPLVRSGDSLYALAFSGGTHCIEGLYAPGSEADFLDLPAEVGCGAILKISDSGGISVAHRFTMSEGAGPYALRAAKDGTLLGVTRFGGAHGRGASFRFDPGTSQFGVLQSLDDDPVSSSAGVFAGGRVAAFADGSVLSESEDGTRFAVIKGGDPADTILTLPYGTIAGPFAIDAGDRAVFLAKSDGDCDAALLALTTDGSVSKLKSGDAKGSAACVQDRLADPVPVRFNDGGEIVANDAARIYEFGGLDAGTSDGAVLSVIFDRTTNPKGPLSPPLVAGTATAGGNGDVFVAADDERGCADVLDIRGGSVTATAALKAPHLCHAGMSFPLLEAFGLASFGTDEVYGTLRDPGTHANIQFTVTGNRVVETSTVDDGTPLDSAAIEDRIEPTILGQHHATTFSIQFSPLASPKYIVDPAKLDIEVSALDVAGAPIRHVHAAISKKLVSDPQSHERSLPMGPVVPIALKLTPGRYAFTVTARNAVTSQRDGSRIPIVNDGETQYVDVAAVGPTATSPDPAERAASAAYVGKVASVRVALPIDCDATPNQLRVGSQPRVTTLWRAYGTASGVGYGPDATFVPKAGDARTQYGEMRVTDPIGVALAHIDGCSDRPTALFASPEQLERYLQPVPVAKP